MSYRHSYEPIALAEYRTAIEWYGERSTLAVDNFISAIDDKIRDICLTP